MENTERKISRGRILHITAKSHILSIKEIAEKAGFKYSTFFTHIKQDNLAYTILSRYGKAMNRDFSVEFPEMYEYVKAEDFNDAYKKKLTYNELLLEFESLRNKYYSAIDKQNQLLQKIIDLTEELDSLRNKRKNN